MTCQGQLIWYDPGNGGKAGLLWHDPGGGGKQGLTDDPTCCCDVCVCDCQVLQDVYDGSPGTLSAVFSFPAACGYGDVGKTFIRGASGTTTPSKTGCLDWTLQDSTFTDFGTNIEIDLFCVDDGVELLTNGDASGNCKFGAATLISFTCDPLEIIFEIEILDGDPPGDPCGACDGEVVTVTITE